LPSAARPAPPTPPFRVGAVAAGLVAALAVTVAGPTKHLSHSSVAGRGDVVRATQEVEVLRPAGGLSHPASDQQAPDQQRVVNAMVLKTVDSLSRHNANSRHTAATGRSPSAVAVAHPDQPGQQAQRNQGQPSRTTRTDRHSSKRGPRLLRLFHMRWLREKLTFRSESL
jgi:hypothetical protein